MKKTNRCKYRKLEIDSNYFLKNYKEKNKRTDYEGLYQDKFNIVTVACAQLVKSDGTDCLRVTRASRKKEQGKWAVYVRPHLYGLTSPTRQRFLSPLKGSIFPTPTLIKRFNYYKTTMETKPQIELIASA